MLQLSVLFALTLAPSSESILWFSTNQILFSLLHPYLQGYELFELEKHLPVAVYPFLKYEGLATLSSW